MFGRQTKKTRLKALEERLKVLEEDLALLKDELTPRVLTSSKKNYGTRGNPVRIIENNMPL